MITATTTKGPVTDTGIDYDLQAYRIGDFEGGVAHEPPDELRDHEGWRPALRRELQRRKNISTDTAYLRRWVSPLLHELSLVRFGDRKRWRPPE